MSDTEQRHDPAHWLTAFNSHARDLNGKHAGGNWAEVLDEARYLRAILINLEAAAERMQERKG